MANIGGAVGMTNGGGVKVVGRRANISLIRVGRPNKDPDS